MMTKDPVYSGGMKEAHILRAHNTITLSETREAYPHGKICTTSKWSKTHGLWHRSVLHKWIGKGEISRRKVWKGIRRPEVSAM
jgi:hypothetical protein